MIRNLLATTAVATLIATGAFAQNATTPAPAAAPSGAVSTTPAVPMVKNAEGHLASNLIGENVYSGIGNDAQNIGKVNDLVIGHDGTIQALIVGVGGFLGIGEKNVALEYELAKWESRDNDEFLVVDTTAEALKAQPEFEAAVYEFRAADAGTVETKPANAPDLTKAPAPAEVINETDDTQTAAIDRSKLEQRQIAEIKADEFIGTTIYGANDANVGAVSDVVMSQDGKVDAVLVDVGTFLGLGGKTVALGIDNLQFMADEDGDLYVYSSLSKEQLEAQPAYDEASYAQNRDTQRMDVPAVR